MVRCGLFHQAELARTNNEFHDRRTVELIDGKLRLPQALVFGLIIAVIVAPSNADERVEGNKVCNFPNGDAVPVNDLWGNREQLMRLLDAK